MLIPAPLNLAQPLPSNKELEMHVTKGHLWGSYGPWVAIQEDGMWALRYGCRHVYSAESLPAIVQYMRSGNWLT